MKPLPFTKPGFWSNSRIAQAIVLGFLLVIAGFGVKVCVEWPRDIGEDFIYVGRSDEFCAPFCSEVVATNYYLSTDLSVAEIEERLPGWRNSAEEYPIERFQSHAGEEFEFSFFEHGEKVDRFYRYGLAPVVKRYLLQLRPSEYLTLRGAYRAKP